MAVGWREARIPCPKDGLKKGGGADNHWRLLEDGELAIGFGKMQTVRWITARGTGSWSYRYWLQSVWTKFVLPGHREHAL